MLKKASLVLVAFAMPIAASAQLENLENIVDGIGRIIDIATPIVLGLALLAFFWGLAKYIFAAGDDERKKEGRNIMIWGIVALFVMVAVWGIVRFIGDALGIDPEETPVVVPRI